MFINFSWMKSGSAGAVAIICLLVHGTCGYLLAGCNKLAYPLEAALDSLGKEIGGLSFVWGKLDSVREDVFSNTLEFSYDSVFPGGKTTWVSRPLDPYASKFLVKTVWVSLTYKGKKYKMSFTDRSGSCESPELRPGDDIPVIFQGKSPIKLLLRYRSYLGWRIVKDKDSKAGYGLK